MMSEPMCAPRPVQPLSRFAKVLAEMPKPERLRQDAGLSAGSLRLELQDPALAAPGLLINGLELAVRRHPTLQFFPQLVHRVQLRTLLGEEDQLDVEFGRKLSALDCLVNRRPIQQQRDLSLPMAGP